LQLRNVDESAGITCAYHVAGIDEADAGPAVERRGDARIAELKFCVVDCGLVRQQRRLQLSDQVLLRVVGLACREAAIDQRSRTRKVAIGSVELGKVARLRGLGLPQQYLEGPRIDLHEKIADPHILPLAKQHLLQLAVDTGFDRDGIVGLHRPDTAHVNRKIATRGLGHRHGSRRQCRLLRQPQRRRSGLAGETPDGSAAGSKGQGHDNEDQPAWYPK